MNEKLVEYIQAVYASESNQFNQRGIRLCPSDSGYPALCLGYSYFRHEVATIVTGMDEKGLEIAETLPIAEAAAKFHELIGLKE